MSLKCVASGDCFSKRNVWSGSHNLKTLTSDLPLESLPTSVCKRRCVCSASLSSHSCINKHVKACTLMWLIILITSCKTLSNSGDIFQLASISLWMTVHRLAFRSNLFDSGSETRKSSSHGSHSVHAYNDAK